MALACVCVCMCFQACTRHCIFFWFSISCSTYCTFIHGSYAKQSCTLAFSLDRACVCESRSIPKYIAPPYTTHLNRVRGYRATPEQNEWKTRSPRAAVTLRAPRTRTELLFNSHGVRACAPKSSRARSRMLAPCSRAQFTLSEPNPELSNTPRTHAHTHASSDRKNARSACIVYCVRVFVRAVAYVHVNEANCVRLGQTLRIYTCLADYVCRRTTTSTTINTTDTSRS